mmetsp:Transcript_69227/g.166005  ORF Transcript_69227/g.166005 Transcript_69227/m.166005 type:complete len:353 (-) Transcript_69227:980-2038(-)
MLSRTPAAFNILEAMLVEAHCFSHLRSWRSNRCLTYSRRSTMSSTVDVLPPRSRTTTSMNSAKLSSRTRFCCVVRLEVPDSPLWNARGSALVFSSKSTSLNDVRSTQSTPCRFRMEFISGLRITKSNSSLLMLPSSFLSKHSRSSVMDLRKAFVSCLSRSAWKTPCTTVTRIPISMFIRTQLLMKMTKTNKPAMKVDSSSKGLRVADGLSSRVHLSSNVHIDVETVANSSRKISTSVCSPCTLKITPNTYSATSRRATVSTTVRIEADTPRQSVLTSGIMCANRDSRSNRHVRRIAADLMCTLKLLPVWLPSESSLMNKSITGAIQASSTVRKDSTASKSHQRSLRQYFHRR